MELCNYNENSVNPDKVIDDQRGVIFRRINPEKDAISFLTTQRRIRQAQEGLDSATPSEVLDLTRKFNLPQAEQEVMVEALYRKAEEGKGYEQILNALSDEAFQITNSISEGEITKVIEWMSNDNCWVWVDTRAVVCSGTPGMTPQESMLAFIQQSSDGEKIKKKLATDVKLALSKKKK